MVEFLPSMLEVLGLILRTITTTTSSSNTSTATTPSPPPPPPPQKLGMVANVCNFCTWELRQEKCHEFEASQVSSNPTQITEWVFVSRRNKLTPTSPQGLGMKPRNGVLASIIPSSDFSGVSAVCCFCCYCPLLTDTCRVIWEIASLSLACRQVYGTFYWLIISVGGPSPLCVPPLGRRIWVL